MASKFTITAELSLQTKNLNQVVRNLQSQFNNANLNVKIKDLAQAQNHIQKISSSSKQASKDVGVLGNSMEQAFKRFTVITAVTGTLIAFTRAVKHSVGEAINFEREVVKISQATGETTSQLSGLVKEINDVSTTFGVASKELILSARTLTQAGFAADRVAGSLKILAQTELAATFDSIQDTTEGAIALLNQFGKQAQKTGSEVKFLEQSFSAINQVSKEFAVESSDLVTAIRTTGSAFETAGGSLNELLALFTSVRSTTRESAESIATGFRTIFTRVQRVDTINALRNLGVELQDVEGKFVGPIEAVKRLSTALNTIDPKDFRFNMVVEELGGFRQVSKVIPLIQQFAVTQKALNVAQGASGSLAKDAETAQQALAVQIAKTREEFQKFMREMVASDTFKSTVGTLLDLASAFIKVADSIKPLIPLVSLFVAAKAGSALVPALRSFGGSKRGGIPIGFATGGLVPGSGNGDTVPAMLSPGEFVIRKSSVNKIGAGNLAEMNRGGEVQQFAKGGPVNYSKKEVLAGKYGKTLSGIFDKLALENISPGFDPNDRLKGSINQVEIPASDAKLVSPEQRKIILSDPNGKDAADIFELIAAKKMGMKISPVKNSSIDLYSDSSVGEVKFRDSSKNSNLEIFSKLIRNSSGKESGSINPDVGKFSPYQKIGIKETSDFGSIDYIIPSPNKKDFVENLSLQKFKTGGTVQNPEFPDILNESKIGAAVLEAGLEPKRFKIDSTSMPGINVKKSWDAVVEGLSPESFDTFRNGIEEGLVKGLSVAAEKSSAIFAKDLGLGSSIKLSEEQTDGFLKTINRSAYGNLFEQVLSLYRTGKFGADDPLRPFDFDNGIDGVLKDDYKNLAGIKYVDAKASFQAASMENLSKKIKNTILNNRENSDEYKGNKYLEKSRVSAIDQRKKGLNAQAFQDSIAGKSPLSSVVSGLSKFSGMKFITASQPLYGEKLTEKNIAEILRSNDPDSNWSINDYVSESQAKDIERILFNARTYKKIGKNLGGFIQKFASGGFASGSDTVPAMLTPGEFVVNKKSAQRIGYSNLNRMNKVAKFANGGTVGKGGTVFDPSQQRLQASMFLGQYRGIISPQQSKLLEGMINGMINAGLDAEKAMKQMAKDINIRSQNRRALHGYLNSTDDIDSKRKKYISIGRGGAEEKSGEAEKARREYIGKLRELSDSSGKAVTNMLILAGITESVVSQFTSMSESYKAGASAFGASLAIYSGITSQLKSFATSTYASVLESRKETVARGANTGAINTNTASISKNSSAEKLQKSFALLDGIFTGFSVGMAAASAAAAYMAKEAEIASKNMSDMVNKFKEDFQSVSQGQLRESINKSFLAEYQSKVVGGGLSSKKTIATVASGAAGGARVGWAFGGVPGALAGGALGGFIGLLTAQKALQQEFERTKDKISTSATVLADTLYQTSKSIIDVKKFIDESKDKTLLDVSKKTAASVEEYGRNVDSLNVAERGFLSVFKTFGEIPEVLKNGLDDAAKSVGQFKGEIDRLVGVGLTKTIAEINSNIGVAGFAPDKAIQNITDREAKSISSLSGKAVKQRFGRTIAGFDQQGLATGDLSAKVNSLSAKEGEKATLEFKKQLAEATVQVINQNLAMSKELKIREALLGVLSKQLALESQISNTNYSLDRDAQNSKAIDSIYSGVVSGLKSNSVSSSILDVKSPAGQNRADFDKALNIIGEFSPLAAKVKDSISEFSKVSSNLDMVLESINFSQLEGEPANRKTATDKIIKGFGVDLGSESAEAIRLAFEKSFDVAFTGAKEGGFSRKERQDLLKSNLSDTINKTNDVGKSILDIASKIESSTREYRDKILQSQQKEIEARLSAVDSQKNYLSLIQKASTGEDLTLLQGDTARFAKQKMLAGNLAGNSGGIGRELNSIRDSLKGDLTDSQRQSLQSKAKKLEMALSDLADQSSRTSDIMSQIDKFRSQRETLSESAKDYAFGTSEDKAKTNQSFDALRTVLNFGDINSISDEMKGSVKELLGKFKDIPLFNGKTGFQVENELAAREFDKSGNFDIAAMLRTQTSSPEQKLIEELKKTSNVEMAARAQILAQEINYQKENTNAIISLTAEIKAQAMEGITKEAKNQQLIAKQQAEFGKAPTEEILNRDMKNVKAIIEITTKNIKDLGDSIEALIAKINQEITKLSKEAIDQANGKFKPNKDLGIVHKAGGGKIFKPKGTDTVPAMLTPGEFVVRKQAVDKIGVDTLNQINTGYFARGGSTRVAKSQAGIESVVTDVRSRNFRAERMRRESPEYAASYAASTGGSATADLYRSYNKDSYQVPKMPGLEKAGEFVAKLDEMVKTMNGMEMTHKITVDGQLNIGGIDGKAIAGQISQALGQYVGNIVKEHLNKQNSRPVA